MTFFLQSQVEVQLIFARMSFISYNIWVINNQFFSNVLKYPLRLAIIKGTLCDFWSFFVALSGRESNQGCSGSSLFLLGHPDSHVLFNHISSCFGFAIFHTHNWVPHHKSKPQIIDSSYLMASKDSSFSDVISQFYYFTQPAVHFYKAPFWSINGSSYILFFIKKDIHRVIRRSKLLLPISVHFRLIRFRF